MDNQKKQVILKTRAAKIALEMTKEDQDETIEVVIFYLNNEKYALETIYVREAYPCKELTPLPGLRPFNAGLINVRRKIISVIDLKILFGIQKEDPSANKVLILGSQEMEFAILIDSLEEVRLIPLKTIQPTLPTLTGLKQEFFKGITVDHLIILDGDKLLKDKRMVTEEKV